MRLASWGHNTYRLTLGLALVVGVVAVVFLAVGRAAPPPSTDWGPMKDGLRTRLVADKTTWTVDERIVLHLELRNETADELSYEEPQGVERPEPRGQLIIRREGKPVRYIAGDFQTAGGTTQIGAGKTRDLGPLWPTDYWDFRAPGHYTVQFPETKGEYAWEDGPPKPKGFRAVLPASNVLELQVKLPPDGQAPPLDIAMRGKVLLAPAGMERPPWQGFAVNYHDLPPMSGEALDAIANVVWPEAPLPLYEGRLLCVAVRMPECRASDRFTVESATVKDSTLRVSVAKTQGTGQSTRVRPYLAFYLDRLLAAGDYTCVVWLPSGVWPVTGGPPPGGYSFRFTIQPPRPTTNDE